MAQVTLSITGGTYAVGCQDGEEDHVRYLAQEVERRLNMVRTQLAPNNEEHALFLTALLMADEVNDLRAGQLNDESRKALDDARKIIEDRSHQEERLHQIADLAERLLGQVEQVQSEEAGTASHDSPPA